MDDRQMNRFGLDAELGHNKIRNKKRLLNKGQCPHCGNQLFRMGGLLRNKKTPLNIENKVSNGRCLLCYPRAAASAAVVSDNDGEVAGKEHEIVPVGDGGGGGGGGEVIIPSFERQSSVPRMLSVDDQSLISGVTDMFLLDESGHEPRPFSSSPSRFHHHNDIRLETTAEVADDNEMVRLEVTPSNSSFIEFVQHSKLDSPHQPQRHRAPMANISARTDNDLLMARREGESKVEITSSPQQPQRTADIVLAPDDYQTALALARSTTNDGCTRNDTNNKNKNNNAGGDNNEIYFSPTNDNPLSLESSNGDKDVVSGASTGIETMHEIQLDSLDCTSEETNALPTTTNPNMDVAGDGAPVLAKESAAAQNDNIDQLLSAVGRKGVNPETRIQLLRSLSAAIWKSGAPGRQTFVQLDGIQLLIQTIWGDLTVSKKTAKTVEAIQLAAADILLALAAPSGTEPDNISSEGNNDDNKYGVDVLVGETAEQAIDALLIMMQTFEDCEPIQQAGCQVLGCLASASYSNHLINDGTQSGAVLTVFKAMGHHATSQPMQECGLRALYNQCVYSQNSENNKRTILNGEAKASNVLRNILLRHAGSNDPGMAERAYQLFWCLSENDHVARILSNPPAGDLISEVARTIQQLREKKECAPLLEAGLATISNLSAIHENHRSIENADDIVSMALKIAILYRDHIGILVESFNVITNLASLLKGKESLVKSLARGLSAEQTGFDALSVILKNIKTSPSDSDLPKAALRAAVAMSIDCSLVKRFLYEKTVFLSIVELSLANRRCADWQELTCQVLSSMYVPNCFREGALNVINKESLSAVSFAMKSHPDVERVQAAACGALRNMSGVVTANGQPLVSEEALDLLILAMEKHKGSVLVQLHACTTLWNLSQLGNCKFQSFDEKVIQCIVASIQNDLGSRDIIESACDMLWSLIDGSDNLKLVLLGIDGGVDTLTSILDMHQGVSSSKSLLEKTCGVLSSLSTSPSFAEAITATNGFGNIIDVMRSESRNIAILHSGVLCLQNVVVAFPSYARIATDVLATVIQAMNANLNESGFQRDFQRDACNFLWVLSVSSSENRSKILALDGMAVFMNTLEFCRDDNSNTGDAALGAFNTVALT